MRKAKYTEEQIIAAGETLRTEGREPTPNAIKTLLGGGKATRIADVWTAHLEASESVSPGESILTETFDPDDNRFAMHLHWPIQGAARQVSRVFENLLEELAEKAEKRLESLIEREEERHQRRESELQGALTVTEGRVEQEREERYRISEELFQAKRTIETLEAAIESMSSQIKHLKEIESS